MAEKVENYDYVREIIRKDKRELINYLQENGLVAKTYKCPKCGSAMKLTPIHESDGYQWSCHVTGETDHHYISRSIRTGTWFSHSEMPLENVLKITYYWVKEYPQKNVRHEMGVDSQTVVDWYNSCRHVCLDILLQQNKKIGGVGKIVEIGESKFGKTDGQWVFGGVCRQTKECFLVSVEDRTTETLLNIIKNKIEPGTTIYSNCWEAYNCLADEGFQHLTVNHSITFKDPVTGCHINTIESLWRQVKSLLPECNQEKILLDSYLAEYMYRYVHKSELCFTTFLKDVAKIYVPNTKDEYE